MICFFSRTIEVSRKLQSVQPITASRNTGIWPETNFWWVFRDSFVKTKVITWVVCIEDQEHKLLECELTDQWLPILEFWLCSFHCLICGKNIIAKDKVRGMQLQDDFGGWLQSGYYFKVLWHEKLRVVLL